MVGGKWVAKLTVRGVNPSPLMMIDENVEVPAIRTSLSPLEDYDSPPLGMFKPTFIINNNHDFGSSKASLN